MAYISARDRADHRARPSRSFSTPRKCAETASDKTDEYAHDKVENDSYAESGEKPLAQILSPAGKEIGIAHVHKHIARYGLEDAAHHHSVIDAGLEQIEYERSDIAKPRQERKEVQTAGTYILQSEMCEQSEQHKEESEDYGHLKLERIFLFIRLPPLFCVFRNILQTGLF